MISTGFFLWRRKYPFLLTGWLWYLGMLVPMIGIIQVGSQVRADRYTYLPQIGLYLLVAWGAMELFHQWRCSKVVLAGAGLLIIIALITRSYFQTSYWQDTETLWKHATATTSNNYIASNNLAEALFQSGRFDEAIAECQKALKIKPDFAAAHIDLGAALLSTIEGPCKSSPTSRRPIAISGLLFC
jgi:tetratricopeptide (TPR) repeat protein